MGNCITIDMDGHVMMIGLNRPEKRNAFNLAVIEQLAIAYERLAADPEIRVGVLYAHGERFSAGLDLAEVGPAVAARGPHVLAGPGRYDPFGVWFGSASWRLAAASCRMAVRRFALRPSSAGATRCGFC